jgi:predicted amidohydrolase
LIKIAAFQGRCTDNTDANLDKVREVIAQAADLRADFLCFPEGYVSNYRADLSVHLDGPRMRALAQYTERYDVVVVVGLSELHAGEVYNTALVLHRGHSLGVYRKTMLTQRDKKVFAPDYSLPVFAAKGITFGVIICHDSSFIEPALTMRWKGARLLFSPHYNRLPFERVDEHRKVVRNNHIGLSALLQMVVVRSNVVGGDDQAVSYGDTAIFSPLGMPIAVAPLFGEALIFAEFEESAFSQENWRTRREIPLEVYQQLWEAVDASYGTGSSLGTRVPNFLEREPVPTGQQCLG